MRTKSFRHRPLLTLPQILVLLAILAALYIALDLNKRAQEGQTVGIGEDTLSQEVVLETTRQIELEATLTYVQSEDYVAAYARNEGGFILPGEKRIVPLVIEATPAPPPLPTPTPDPINNVQQWQAWWQLMTDAPQPSR